MPPNSSFDQIARADVLAGTVSRVEPDVARARTEDGVLPRGPVGLGLHMAAQSPEVDRLLGRLVPHLAEITVIGRLVAETETKVTE